MEKVIKFCRKVSKKTSTYFGIERDENKEQKTRPEYQLNECRRRYLSKSKHQQVTL